MINECAKNFLSVTQFFVKCKRTYVLDISLLPLAVQFQFEPPAFQDASEHRPSCHV